ncbi:hypothetical protein [Candidatus Pyrohabitans sp.]
MDKKDFLERFCLDEEDKHKRAERISKGMVRYERKKNVIFTFKDSVAKIDLCEVCRHPKGMTYTLCEVLPSFEGADVSAMLMEAKEKAEVFCRSEGPRAQCIINIVIPPEPGMIMELGEHLAEMTMLGNFAVTVYDTKSGKMGMLVIDESFLSELREDPDYEEMSDAEIFANFMMNYADLL